MSAYRRALAATSLLALIASSPSDAALLTRTGDMAAELLALPLGNRDSNLFVAIADPADATAWQSVISSLLSNDPVTAATLAAAQDYDLWIYTDTVTHREYHLLVEQRGDFGNPIRGQGTYLFNPKWKRALNIQSPHFRTNDDQFTGRESFEAFLRLEALFLQAAGAHSDANMAVSACQGDHRSSDVAHNLDNFFQTTSNTVATAMPALVSINVHGWVPSGTPQGLEYDVNTSLAVITNGTCSARVSGCAGGELPNSISTQLAYLINRRLDAPEIAYSGVGAGSENWAPDDPEGTLATEIDTPSGNTNVQGRWINGETADPCGTDVANAPVPERFIHLEQQRPLRRPPTDQLVPGIDYTLVIEELGNLFPISPVLELGVGSRLDLGDASFALGCSDLTVDGTLGLSAGDISGMRDVTVAEGGTILGGTGSLSQSGDWTRSGAFVAAASRVMFEDGCNRTSSTINGDNSFAELVLTTNSGRSYLFEAGSTQTVALHFSAIGLPAKPLRLRSTENGVRARTNVLVGQSIAAVDVQDNAAIGAELHLDQDSLLSGNAPGWLLASVVPMLSVPALLLVILAACGVRELRGSSRGER